MSNKIQKLKDVILSDIKLSAVLSDALIIAQEHDEEFIPWLKNEMNGYPEGSVCPEYRFVSGKPAIKDAKTGKWEDLFFIGDNLEFSKGLLRVLSKISVSNPVAFLEDMNADERGLTMGIYYPYPEDIQHELFLLTQTEGKFGLRVEHAYSAHILSEIRGKLLNWVKGLKPALESELELDISIFPENLRSRLPKEIDQLIGDFNANYSQKRARVCMLILRRILPLAIVRKFQKIDNEKIIKKENGEFMDTKSLLGQAECHLISCNKGLCTKLTATKMELDQSQHSYSFRPEISDVYLAGKVIRLFLDEIFD